jgi:acyl-CoA thioester hydrolase
MTQTLEINMTAHFNRPFEIELSFQVKSYDVDYVGYVHNAVYIRWLEDLRLAMLAAHYPLEQCVNEGISPIILRTTIEYKKPLRLFDRFTGKVWVSKLEGIRWTVNHEMTHNGIVVAMAEQFGIFISLSTRRPVPIPDGLVQKFKAIQARAIELR